MPGTDTTTVDDTSTEGDVIPAASLQDLTPGSLQPHPRNPRVDADDVTELADSIRAKGLIHPIVVVPATAKNKFRIVAGHRRHAAAKVAGLKRIPCIVRTDLDDEADQLATMLLENESRSDLNVVEEAAAVQGLLELGDSVTGAAARTGMSKRRIGDRIKVANMSPEMKAKLVEHSVSLEDALFLAKHSEDLADAELLESKLGTHDWPFAKQRVAENEARRKKIAKLAKDLESSDLEVVSGPGVAAWKANHGVDGVGFTSERHPWTTLAGSREYSPTESFVMLDYDQSSATIWRYRAVDPVLAGDRDPLTSGGGISGGNSSGGVDAGSRGDGPAPTPTPAVDDSRAARMNDAELERVRVKDDLKTAEAVRAAHLVSVIKSADSDAALALLKNTALVAIDDLSFMTAAEAAVLGVTTIDEVKALVTASTSLVDVAILLGLLTVTGEHLSFDDPHGWMYDDGRTGRAIELIGGPLGYEWSSIELEMIANRKADLDPVDDDQDPAGTDEGDGDGDAADTDGE